MEPEAIPDWQIAADHWPVAACSCMQMINAVFDDFARDSIIRFV
jgi:hypothetical protein